MEAFKDVGLVGAGNADAMVDYLQLEPLGNARHGQLDRLIRRRVFVSVFYQVDQHLMQAGCVAKGNEGALIVWSGEL